MLHRRLSLSISAAACIVLCLGLTATAISFTAIRGLEQARAVSDFRQHGEARIAAIRRGMDDAVQSLLLTNRLFDIFESVSREQFHAFMQPLLERYPYIKAFNFHRLVAAAERPAYEAEMRKRYPDFTITEIADGRPVPAAARDRYNVVDYLEPMRGNEGAFGFDSFYFPSSVEAFRRAVDTGLPVATGLFPLAQSADGKRGFAILVPVYRHGTATADKEERHRAVIGDTAAIFGVDHLMAQIVNAGQAAGSSEVDISMYAGDRPDERALVFRKGIAPAVSQASLALSWLFYDQPKSVSQNFEVAGQAWHIVIAPQPVWFSVNHKGALLALIVGVLLSVLAAVCMQIVQSRTREVRRLADQRTAELQIANQRLSDDGAALRLAEQALHLREHAIQSSVNAVAILSAIGPHYRYEWVNPAFERMTGYSAAETLGQPFGVTRGGKPGDYPDMAKTYAALCEKREGRAIWQSVRKDGTHFWSDAYVTPVKDETGAVSHFVMMLYDVTATKCYEEELLSQVNRDILTGLANRHFLRNRLQQALGDASSNGKPVWVAFIDLDRFKFINDTLGYQAGDKLMKAIANRLETLPDTQTVARFSSDEFALVLLAAAERTLTAEAMQRALELVRQPLAIDGRKVAVTCSIGVAVYPNDGTDANTLIRHADIAMCRAKDLGRDNVQFYAPEMNEGALQRLRLEQDLRNALEREEFELHYQPQIDAHTGAIVGAEALIRWRHPELGMVPPADFIGLAEETGLIVPIGAWVLRTACAQGKAWQRSGLKPLRIAVNLSARQLVQQDIAQSIAAILDETGLEPQYLELELTESTVMTRVEQAIGILWDLKRLGVYLSVDDFGTGYSSLAYLKRFPIDLLKIDRSFVRDLGDSPDDAQIVVTIISLAHNLRLQVIAEGVETLEQLAFLQLNRCDYLQGYYIAKPMPAEAFETMLVQGKGTTQQKIAAG